MFKPCANHLENTWKPGGGHVQTMCKPCANHMQNMWKAHETMWGPCRNHMKTMWGACANHVQTTWKYTCRICMFCSNSCKSASICLVHIPINVLGWMEGWQCANHVQTMCNPSANHVQSMCKPCANHVRSRHNPYGNHMKIMWGGSVLVVPKPNQGFHVETTWKPCEGHVQTMWKPHENHVGTCANHMQTMWKPHENHVGRQCPGGPKSQTPRPNQGFQMKFGWLSNTWSSKNATCRGDIIYYISVFYICMICIFLVKLIYILPVSA